MWTVKGQSCCTKVYCKGSNEHERYKIELTHWMFGQAHQSSFALPVLSIAAAARGGRSAAAAGRSPVALRLLSQTIETIICLFVFSGTVCAETCEATVVGRYLWSGRPPGGAPYAHCQLSTMQTSLAACTGVAANQSPARCTAAGPRSLHATPAALQHRQRCSQVTRAMRGRRTQQVGQVAGGGGGNWQERRQADRRPQMLWLCLAWMCMHGSIRQCGLDA